MTGFHPSRPSMRVVCSLLATLACGAVLFAGARRTPGQSQSTTQVTPERQVPPVTFKVEVNYVEVDAVVVDKQGNFVSDLGRDAFQVFEDGKPQKISAFSFVNIPIARAEKPLFSPRAIEPDVRTNTKGLDGRIYLIVLDDLHVNPMQTPRVQAAARRLVEQEMGANDMAAVVCTSGRTDASQDFTSDKRLLLDAIAKFMGRKLRAPTLERLEQYARTLGPIGSTPSTDDPLEAERSYNARTSLDSLRRLCDFLSSVHGRRKALIYLSEGVDYNVNDPINNRYATEIREAAQDAIAAATRANVNIYAVDPRGLTNMSGEEIEIAAYPQDTSLGLGPESLQEELRLSQDSLRTVSEETGGFAVVNTNDFNKAFDRIVTENSSYYVLGYYPSNDRRDGRFRKIEVKVDRPGLVVRSRKGYTAPSGKAPTAKPAIEHNSITSPEIREALGSPVPMSGFGLSVFAACFKNTPQKASVVITVEGRGADLKFAEKDGRFQDTVQASILAVDHEGKVAGGEQQQLPMNLKPETRPIIQRDGFRIMSRMDLAPGRYQLRIASRDTEGGHVGSVYYDLTVPDFTKPPLAMSGLVLASRRFAGVPTPKPDPDLAKMLPAPPTTVREFSSDDELAALVEVYDNRASTAHKVDIETDILAEGGRSVFHHADERSTDELHGKNGGFGYVVRIPLRDIPPGLYVLRVQARSTLGKTEPVSEQLQFAVRAGS